MTGYDHVCLMGIIFGGIAVGIIIGIFAAGAP